MSYQPNMTMRSRPQASALAILLHGDACRRLRTNFSGKNSDTIVFAMMSGKCSTLKVAGRDFTCRAVAFFQTEEGRANFTVALDDPNDDSHIITFSGDNGRRPEANLYELPIDRMLLKSKDRPKADGLPVPSIGSTAGMCTQVGKLRDARGFQRLLHRDRQERQKYELRYQSDGTPTWRCAASSGCASAVPRCRRSTEMMALASRPDSRNQQRKAAGGEPTAASVDPRMARVCVDKLTLVCNSSRGVEAVRQSRAIAFMRVLPRGTAGTGRRFRQCPSARSSMAGWQSPCRTRFPHLGLSSSAPGTMILHASTVADGVGCSQSRRLPERRLAES